MKKTVKKSLSMLLAIMMLMSSLGINMASAACNHQISTGDPNYYKIVNPTCEQQGYTIYNCIYCGQEVSRGDYKDALGHKPGADEYEANGEGDYRKFNVCTRQYTQDGVKVTCSAKLIEEENGKEVVYHRVDFVNNKVTATYDDSVEYVKLAATYKSMPLLSTYVKHGEAAVYDVNKPVRERTKEFARYAFIGWSEKSSLEATVENNLGQDDVTDITAIEKNMTLYPVFEGLTSDSNGIITHNVRFYTFEKGNTIVPLTNVQQVAHRQSPKFSAPNGVLYDDPVKQEDLVNTYAFSGWSTKSVAPYGTLIPTSQIESTPIYGNVNFYATFAPTAKNYTVVFYGDGGKTPLKYEKDGAQVEAVFDGINLKTNLLLNEDINGINNNDKLLAKPSDDEYIYIWTGNWAILTADGQVGRTVDLKSLDLYASEYTVAKDADNNTIYVDENGIESATGTEEKKIIRLVPVYRRSRQLYAVDIEMLIPSNEDSDYYRGEADVHVVANNGQLVASGKTNADGIFRCYLYYQLPMTVTVATQDGKYLGQAQIHYLEKSYDGSADLEAQRNKCAVQMELNPEYETHCSCIHHVAFIQPLWVRILNLLYNFFNVKYVCCYDMYSTIGPLLDYTA